MSRFDDRVLRGTEREKGKMTSRGFEKTKGKPLLAGRVASSVRLFMCILFLFTLVSYSFAEDFTAKTIGDYGNVTVMEVTGNYDAKNPDGSINAEHREIIAKEFFKTHKDEYDFIVIFSNFDFQMPEAEVKAFYTGVKNDTQGIGRDLFDYSSLFGSNGKLQGTIDMGNIATLVIDPLDPNFEQTLSILAHEQLHRWAAYVKFKDSTGNVSTSLLGKDDEHWSFLLDSYGSVLYGNRWQDNGNGTFTSIAAERYYSPLDLYLMGFNDKSQVLPMLLIENSEIDPARMPETGATITGTPRYISIDDIIAAEGDRIPSAADSQKTFKTAFIFITTPGTFTGNELYGIENIRNGWVTRFSALTGGKGIMQVTPTLIGNIPVNPGPVLPPITPRTLPPNIDDGVQWLMANQKNDGSWTDLAQTTDRDTAEAVLALKNFPVAQQSYSLGSQWLNGDNSENIDYLSRKIEALANSGQDLSAFSNLLISKQNADSGWGGEKSYMSNTVDTSFALKALVAESYSDQSVISPAIAYINSKQNVDGGWGGDDKGSTIEATAAVLTAFNKYRGTYQLEDQIGKGITWLTQRQNTDGGFGNSPSTVYDTALAVLTLRELNASMDITNNGINYILAQQSGDGSWNSSPYQTALAVSATWKATVEPDLSIKATDITFIPPSVSAVPSNIVMNVTMWNLGRTDVPQAKVALYDGSISDANKIGEQVVAFPGQSSVTVTFSITVTDGNEHKYYVSIDPENLIEESNKSNNTVLKILSPVSTYDFDILPSDVSASPNPADIFYDVSITSKVSNKGTMNAYNVQLKYYIDDPQSPFDIATVTVDIPAGATITNQISWRANKAGENLPLAVVVDPFNTFTEASKDNNKAITSLTVNGSTLPNLTISYKDIVITPSPVNQAGNANISAIVRNEGFSAVQNVKVNFYKGTPGVDGIILGSQTILSLDAGGSIGVSLDWTNIAESGDKIIYIRVDPDNQVTEISKDDNDAFTTLKILSYPDLAISSNSISFIPPAPKDGDTVSIKVTVKNMGEQTASDINVRAYEGSNVIGTQTIPSISGNSQAITSFTYDTTGKSGAHQITVIVDPDNTITEQSKNNNSASGTFGVQNSSLWLTEQYISPNGDGVKDSTQFFFTLNTPQNVKVLVVNSKGQTVRTFSGSDLNNITSGNITWDGLDDNGMVVDDGQYQLKVVDSNNNALGSLLIVVDNNRSPLTDAIGTKYLLNNNLTCLLPDSYDWQWFPDESSILLWIGNPDQNTPEYPTGLYTISPDGEDVLRVIPWEWTVGIDGTYDFSVSGYEISPSGDNIAFILNKRNKTLQINELNQMWVTDRYGSNLTLLDSYDLTQESNAYIDYLGWSPDSQYIIYMAGNPTVLWLIKSDGSGKTEIDPEGGDIDFSTVKWSPDSNKIAYTVFTYDAQWNPILNLRVADISGNKEDVFSSSGYWTDFEWFDNETIVASAMGEDWSTGSLWLVDAGGAGNNIKISDALATEFSVAPDRQSLAFSNSLDSTAYLYISDIDGNVDLMREFKYTYRGTPQIRNIIWSQNGDKIAFIETASCPDCSTGAFVPDLAVMEIEKKETKTFPRSFSLELNSWLHDDVTIIGDELGNLYNNASLVAINTETAEHLSVESQVIIAGEPLVSPFERYITYYKSVDQSSVCYGRGTQDLWAISSLLNLTADLRATKEKSGVILKGIAADLNFEGYVLEYADVKDPNTWKLVAPPSNVPVVNDVFTTWVPPYEGTFHVRLTVSDKAGNTAISMKRVVWGLSSSITNLYKNYDIFSPNGDGVKDAVELHYTVLEPVHLEFNIYDESDNMIRAISKDYANPADDYITWDGRNSSGKIVPDGKYKIKVFDFEFFVEVDSTPPEVGMGLSSLKEDVVVDPITGKSTLIIHADLNSHAVDNNLKNWIIEYGEDDNPQQWYEFETGEEQLVGKDTDGNPILDPIKDTTISIFRDANLEWLTGKKLRITAEDFAGNRTSAITDFLEERIIIDKWDDLYILEDATIPADLSGPGLHSISGVETIRLPIVSMNVQYLDKTTWVDDVPVVNPPSGIIDIKWDNSSLALRENYELRIKAIDILGNEIYSNTFSTETIFSIKGNCYAGPEYSPLSANNSLAEKLSLLKLQVKSGQDARYTQWTDYEVFDSGNVPEGKFDPPLPSIINGLTYSIKMVGIGISGRTHESNVTTYPVGSCPFTIKLQVDYKEADCGLVSGKAVLSAITGGSSIAVYPRTLTYSIQEAGGFQTLQEFDLTREGWGSAAVDTSSLAEGSYTVKVVLSYLDLNDNTVKEISATNILIVDRVLPISHITYPDQSVLICPVTVSGPRGKWFGIPVEGIATDNVNVKRYELYYGVGQNSVQWLPATYPTKDGNKQIIGHRQVQGQLGTWNVTDLKGTDFSFKLKVTDVAGNTSCYTTSFSVDNVIEIANLSADKSLFSPNGDGILDDLTISYEIDKYATVDVKVFKLVKQSDGNYVLDSSPVRIVISGLTHLGGIENTTWDGKDDSGVAVPDGLYGIAVFAKDSCGNTNIKWIRVEVDNTPPIAVIAYPKPGDPLGNIVEIHGTTYDPHIENYTDPHFQNYTLEAGQGDNPDTWSFIASGAQPVKDDVLGAWNTFGLDGRWTLRLTAIDTVGNKNVIVDIVDLGPRKTLVKDFNAAPRLFSPNNDGRLDVTAINYSLSDSCSVGINILDSGGAVRRTYSTTTPSAGTYVFVWDGSDSGGLTVPDGIYTVKLHVALSSNPLDTEDEALTTVVDSTPPTIDVTQPLSSSFFQDVVLVSGTISDTNLQGYSINYSGDTGTTLFDQANQNRENYIFGTISRLAEGNYTLNVSANDLAGSTAQRIISFTIDRTPPKVVLDTPKDGDLYGSNNSTVTITGSIVEANLDSFSLRYGLGDSPSQWTELLSGNTIPANPQLFSWNVGKNAGVPDGLYTLSLYAKDKVGLTGETKVKVMIDNNPPEVAITSPQDGGYVIAPSDIKGTATDPNLDKYTVELSEGQCASAYKWSAIKTSASQVRDGTLALWQVLPSDGYYCVRLTATDKAGNKSEAKVGVKVDTQPPAIPVLSGAIDNRMNARLTWTQDTESDLAGYNLYRDAKKVNAAIIRDITYLDQNLKEGVYAYTVTALDQAGNESKPSNEVKLKVNLTPPDARISVPQDGSKVGGLLDIKGTAYSSDDFKQYRVSIGIGSNPASWSLIRTSPVPTSYGTLSQWDTTRLSEGLYSIKLEAEDLIGNINTRQITVTVDNTPPAPPVLISAIPNGSDVTLTWQANAESDLAGYLLYRNDQLANVSGLVVGDLRPYLITGTTYLDKALPDGKFKYYLIAMDQAGNQSGQSNRIEVNIDTHPPHATITDPKDGTKFQNKIMVKAESTDTDIASVQFQYKKASDTAWVNLGSPVTQTSYVTYLDPSTSGLTYGDYNLRAVATDQGGKTDPSPGFITVTYTDLTAPNAPVGLKALTDGKDVTLTWTANSETDLAGYNVYRTSGSSKTKINATVIAATAYQDTGLADGSYSYEVTAVDTDNNESSPSNSASAKIYAPSIAQPYTPVGKNTIEAKGNNAAASSTIEIFNQNASGSSSAGTVNADAQGHFIFGNLNLVLGENRITAKATDSAGNISRESDAVVVVYAEPPATPTGFAATVNGHDVSFIWDPNTEPDLSGYNLYRNGIKVNAATAITAGNITASSSYSPPDTALDSDPSTYWVSYDSGLTNPSWWEIDIPSPELISHMEIHWGSEPDSQGNETLYAGKDYEIQVWSGYAWITEEQVTGNTEKDNAFDFIPSYRTDRIRIYITDSTDPDTSSKQVRISEINILKDNLITETSYTDSNVHDGTYSYTLTAVEYYGFESQPSEEIETVVGDIVPPSAPTNLTATPSGSNVNLSWTPNTDSDLLGYNVYRNTSQGWMKINADPVTVNAYTDSNLPNGTYIYRVTAVDVAGNESLPSNEAMGIPSDTVPPPAPVLFFPTIPETLAILYRDKTDISGFADPASAVELYKDGVLQDTTSPFDRDVIRNFALDSSIWDMAISPDGKTIAYVDNGALWLKALSTDNTVQITRKGYYPVWSPDGNKVAFILTDDPGYDRIAIYDTEKGGSIPVTDDTYVSEGSPSWSFDGGKIAFISNREGSNDVWIKDLNSSSLTRATNSGNTSDARLSPDGKKLAYFENQNLYIVDLSNGNTVMVDDNTDWYPLDWSPDSKKLLFVSYAAGNGDVFVYDSDNATKTRLTVSDNGVDYPVWSPDGNTIVFAKFEADWSTSIWIMASNAQDQRRLLPQNLINLNYLLWSKTGGIVFRDKQDELNFVYLKGYFNFKDVQLDAGENIFYATSTDASGNISLPADEICVVFDTSLMPDLEITADDIFIYPPYPIAGQTATITATVRNREQVDVKDVAVDVYLQDPQGSLKLLKSGTIPSMAAGSDASINLALDTTGRAGTNKIAAIVDPRNQIPELIESNNTAEKEFFVADKEGTVMTTTLDLSQYKSSQDVNILIDLKNSGIEKDGTVETMIEDEGGQTVAAVDTRTVQLPYATEQNYKLTWNTGSTYAGSYRVHTIFKEGTNIITESTAPFTILPDMNIDSTMITNKIDYASHEDVSITINTRNSGENYIIPGLNIKIKVMDASNNILFTDDKNIINLLPGATVTLPSTWDTGLNPPGDYNVAVEIYSDDKLIAGRSIAIRINTAITITGSVAVSPPVVAAGNTAQAAYVVQNIGNAVINGLPINILIIDPETQIIAGAYGDTINLGMNTARNGTFTFSTLGYALKTYIAALQIAYQGNTKTIATASFIVKDVTPPELPRIITPPDASVVTSDTVAIRGSAEPASTVRMDFAGVFTSQADSVTGDFIFSGVRLAPGKNTFVFTASDRAGNVSAPTQYVLIFTALTSAVKTDKTKYNPNESVSITSFIRNTSANVTLQNLTARVTVINSQGQNLYADEKQIQTIPPYQTLELKTDWNTASNPRGIYTVKLEVLSVASTLSTATTTFEVKPALEITKKIPDLMNLLVWVNNECEKEHEKPCSGINRKDRENEEKDEDKDGGMEKCIKTDLLETILKEAVESYHIVFDKKDFEKELRNPYYTDILILGNHYPLEDHFKEELREKVYSGTGIISSLWLRHGEHGGDDEDKTGFPMFGVRYKGKISGESHTINMVQSPITTEGVVNAEGEAVRVEAVNGTTIAGWIKAEKDWDRCHDKGSEPYPAIILNAYGNGRSVYYAFDLGSTLDDINVNQLSTIIKNSLSYVHRQIDTTFIHAYQLIPVETVIKSLEGAFDLKIIETYPSGIKLYDLSTGKWVTDNPWIINLHLDSDGTETNLYYALTPDEIGTYTLNTEAGYIENGSYNFCFGLGADIVVTKDIARSVAEVIETLKSLSVSREDKEKLNNAIKYMSRVRDRVVASDEDIEKDIHDILEAIESLLSITSVDTSIVRLMMDGLLETGEGRWYYNYSENPQVL